MTFPSPLEKKRRNSALFETGEFGLLRHIEKWCRSFSGSRNPGFKIQAGLGDDAFVAKLTTHSSLAFSTDTLLEGTHFRLDWMGRRFSDKIMWQSLGYKAAAVNLSDLAAMGAVSPLFGLVTLGLNGDISVDNVENLYRGIHKASREFRFFIAGGDIIRSDKSIISMTIVGQMHGCKPILRSGANAGDVLMVSGPLGLSSAGLKILTKQAKSKDSYESNLIRAHMFPIPRLKEGRILAGEDIMATSLIDTSDDLRTSLERLSEKSRVGFEVSLEEVPVDPDLVKFSKAFRVSPDSLILEGGEDYQLLFTVPPSKVPKVKNKIPSAYVLGRVRDESFGIQIRPHQNGEGRKEIRFKHF